MAIKSKMQQHKKLIVTISVLVVFLVCLFIGGQFYFSSYVYEFFELPYPLATHLKEATYQVDGQAIKVAIPKEVVTTEILIQAKDTKAQEPYRLTGMHINSQGLLEVNGRYRGFDFSVQSELVFQVIDTGVLVHLLNPQVNGFHNRFQNRQTHIITRLLGDFFPMHVPLETTLDGELVALRDVYFDSGDFYGFIQVDVEGLRAILEALSKDMNATLLAMVRESDSIYDQQAVAIMTQIDFLDASALDLVIEGVMHEGELINTLLLLGDIHVVDRLFETYGNYLKAFDQDEINQTKGNILSGNLQRYYTQLMTALEGYPFLNDTMYIQLGQPYSFQAGTVTVEHLHEAMSLTIPEAILERLSFVYDQRMDAIQVAYQVDSDTYLVIGDAGENIYRQDAFMTLFDYGPILPADAVQDRAVWSEIVDDLEAYFSGEPIFIRYMKTDGKDLFVVASPANRYQNIWSFAYQFIDGQWVMVMDNITSILNLNRNLPSFNIGVATIEIETVNFFQVNESTRQNIIADLINKGLIQASDNRSIVYVSYGNSHLSVKLDDGSAFVYYVYGSHLHTVYTMETALSMWQNIPGIILLQEQP